MTSSSQGLSDVPEQLWFLCPRVHTVITVRRPPIPPEPPEARPKLHYIFTYPFRKSTTNFDQIALASLLTSILSKWKEQGPSSREYTFSLRYTEVSWQAWAKLCEPSTTSRVQSALVRWKNLQKNIRLRCWIDTRSTLGMWLFGQRLWRTQIMTYDMPGLCNGKFRMP